MRDILVYLSNKESISEIQNLFNDENYRLTMIEDLDDVVDACRQDLYEMAMVWPATHEKTADFITLLDANQFKYIPVVAVTRDEKQVPHLMRLPIADLIKLPVPRLEFFYLLNSILDDIDVHATVVKGMNWQGSIAEYNLIDLIQMMEAGGRSEELVMRFGEHTGLVFFHEGKLLDAKFSDLTGEAALYKLAFWPKGQFQTKASSRESSEVAIGKSNQEVLIDLIEALHKQEQLYEDLPGLDEEILKNPLTPKRQLTPLQEKITKLCESPVSLFHLLISLNENNEDILQELKLLFKMSVVGNRSDVETQVKAKQDAGLGSFLAAIFKKKPEIEEGYYYYQGFIEEEEPRGLVIPPLKLQQADIAKIEGRLEGINE